MGAPAPRLHRICIRAVLVAGLVLLFASPLRAQALESVASSFGPLRPKGICSELASKFRKPLVFDSAKQAATEEMLRSNPVTRVRLIKDREDTCILHFRNGERGVFKFDLGYRDHDYRAEVAAYEVAKRLGIMKVPPTVFRKVQVFPGEGGLREGSVQYWIPDSRPVDELRAKPFMGASAKQFRREYLNLDRGLEFLDHLIGNWDRNSGNLVYRFSSDGPEQFGNR
jgi:hypothetical protein